MTKFVQFVGIGKTNIEYQKAKQSEVKVAIRQSIDGIQT